MGYNKANYRKIKHEYDGKNLLAKENAQNRRRELHALFPEIREIDSILDGTGLEILSLASRYSGERLNAEIEKLKNQRDTLLADRAECLKFHGYPADYSDVKYECADCSDTGFVGIKMCHCMREKLILAGYESSGIGRLIAEKTFDSFKPEYQKGDGKITETVSRIHTFCRKYAEDFETDKSPSLLFIGATGLGKTHLSAAIAGKVIEDGCDALCVTAQNMFSDFEYERFNRPYGSYDQAQENKTDKYFECDLLIIDDLGTEMSNQFTVSCLYNVINTRINNRRPTIINTNLTRDELMKRYSERITSRLFGEFLPIVFTGHDMREILLG